MNSVKMVRRIPRVAVAATTMSGWGMGDALPPRCEYLRSVACSGIARHAFLEETWRPFPPREGRL